MSTSIRTAGPGDVGPVADLVATAFAGLRATAWLVPDSAVRVDVLRADFRILVEHAVEHGDVDVVEDGAGAAVWFPRADPLPEPPDYERRLAEACGPWTQRFTHLDELFAKNHPESPHHHLALLAVRPDHQDRGLGSALLRHRHALLDAAGTPAYLEASSPRSRALYLRHGYRDRPPFDLPDGTRFWPMWRRPGEGG
ncbi:GNAT family N-acetyltransferase [Actinomadura formosensis]|uniref:GNAT family N-acetyltransferase n=1 Tax=Actinomadura formosensis TaxID=60706 RepID=UPI00082B457A|nr:GNAT family N-acetyltransferase [Actinomadura formosensis]